MRPCARRCSACMYHVRCARDMRPCARRCSACMYHVRCARDMRSCVRGCPKFTVPNVLRAGHAALRSRFREFMRYANYVIRIMRPSIAALGSLAGRGARLVLRPIILLCLDRVAIPGAQVIIGGRAWSGRRRGGGGGGGGGGGDPGVRPG